MAAFCRRHSYRGGKSPAQLLSRQRSAPVAPVELGEDTLRTIITRRTPTTAVSTPTPPSE